MRRAWSQQTRRVYLKPTCVSHVCVRECVCLFGLLVPCTLGLLWVRERHIQVLTGHRTIVHTIVHIFNNLQPVHVVNNLLPMQISSQCENLKRFGIQAAGRGSWQELLCDETLMMIMSDATGGLSWLGAGYSCSNLSSWRNCYSHPSHCPKP